MEQHQFEQQATLRAERNKRGKNKGIRWVAWGVGGLIGLVLIAVIGISLYVGWSLTHPDRKVLDDDPENYGLTYERLEVKSVLDQITLRAWLVEAEEPKGLVILAHGYRGNRLESALPALALTQDLVESGYHVSLFDFRNSGESEGSLTTVGYHEKYDLLSIVHFAKERYPELPVAVIGFSMGASTALVAAAEEPLIEAIVADSPFADLREYLEVNLPYWSNLPNFPFTFIIMHTLPVIMGIDVDQVSPRESVKQITAPLLLIHGDGDRAIPYDNSQEIYTNAVSDTVELWIPEGSGHVKGYADYPDEYKRRVLQFLDQHLKKSNAK